MQVRHRRSSAATNRLLQLRHPIGLVFRDRPDIEFPTRPCVNKPSSKYLSVDRLPAFGDVIHGTEMDATHGRISSGQVDNFEAIADGPVVGVAGDDLQTFFSRLVLGDGRRQRPTLTADDPPRGATQRYLIPACARSARSQFAGPSS